MYRRVFLALAFLAAIVGSATPSLAQGRFARGPYYGGVRPFSEVLPQIRRAYPGRFYDAEGPYPDEMGNLHYRVKWMTPDGRIIWIDTDARTGRIIGPANNNWRMGAPPPPPPIGYGPPNGGQFGYGRPPPRGFPPPYRGGWGNHGGNRPHG